MRSHSATAIALALAGLAYPAAAEPMSKAEIEQAVVGKTVRFSGGREARYAASGDYVFIGDGMSSGKYTISDGKICVTFTNGNTRCDKIHREGGDKLAYENAGGQKWVGSIK